MAEIRFRIRGPGWVETVTMAEDKTYGELEQWITAKHDVKDFQLKGIYPPKTIDSTAKNVTLKELDINSKALNLVLSESPAATEQPEIQMPTPQRAESFKPKPVDAEESDLEWPERNGYLVLRVMADDNSCMFTAFGGAILLPDPAKTLRKQVADYILEHQDKYNKVVLEDPPQVYARKIQDPGRWGGAIELGILSEIYNIEICSIDVKTLRVDHFGEGKANRCILVYSGVHYDRIAFTTSLGAISEFDVVVWTTDDDEVIVKARELCKKLQKAHYYTDTQEMVSKCLVPGCDWIGQGQKSMVDHTKATGHVAFDELDLRD